MEKNITKIKDLVKQLLVELGEDPYREGLINTPERVAKSLLFLTSGTKTDGEAILNKAFFTQQIDSMIVVRDIEIYSLCEHHMLPFFGKCHVGYICKDKIPGCSKIARLVDMYARRLQIQERLTEEISNAVQQAFNASGVGVMIEAQHLCMMMRGIQKQNSRLVTSSVLGSFRSNAATRHEFLSLVST